MTEEQLAKFQELYKAEFNEDITREQALEIGLRLVNLFRTIISPYPTGKPNKN